MSFYVFTCVSEVSICLGYDVMSIDDVQEEILDVSAVEDETTMQLQSHIPKEWISQVWHSSYHAVLDYLTFSLTCTLMQ